MIGTFDHKYRDASQRKERFIHIDCESCQRGSITIVYFILIGMHLLVSD
jgi:hypothetical protein